MKWLIPGIALMVAAVAAVVVLIFVPMMAPSFRPVNDLLDSLLCDAGEQYQPRQIVVEHFDGTGYNLHAVCIGERGERDVTPTQTLYGLFAFAVPFLPGLGLTILGATRIAAHRNRPRDVSHLFGGPRAQTPIDPIHRP